MNHRIEVYFYVKWKLLWTNASGWKLPINAQTYFHFCSLVQVLLWMFFSYQRLWWVRQVTTRHVNIHITSFSVSLTCFPNYIQELKKNHVCSYSCKGELTLIILCKNVYIFHQPDDLMLAPNFRVFIFNKNTWIESEFKKIKFYQ